MQRFQGKIFNTPPLAAGIFIFYLLDLLTVFFWGGDFPLSQGTAGVIDNE
jgi:hypothetical protein